MCVCGSRGSRDYDCTLLQLQLLYAPVLCSTPVHTSDTLQVPHSLQIDIGIKDREDALRRAFVSDRAAAIAGANPFAVPGCSSVLLDVFSAAVHTTFKVVQYPAGGCTDMSHLLPAALPAPALPAPADPDPGPDPGTRTSSLALMWLNLPKIRGYPLGVP